jgi:hypothetical protein
MPRDLRAVERVIGRNSFLFAKSIYIIGANTNV